MAERSRPDHSSVKFRHDDLYLITQGVADARPILAGNVGVAGLPEEWQLVAL